MRGLYYVKEAEEDFPETWSKVYRISAKLARHDASDIKCEWIFMNNNSIYTMCRGRPKRAH